MTQPKVGFRMTQPKVGFRMTQPKVGFRNCLPGWKKVIILPIVEKDSLFLRLSWLVVFYPQCTACVQLVSAAGWCFDAALQIEIRFPPPWSAHANCQITSFLHASSNKWVACVLKAQLRDVATDAWGRFAVQKLDSVEMSARDQKGNHIVLFCSACVHVHIRVG